MAGYWTNVLNALQGKTFKLSQPLPSGIKFFEHNGKVIWQAADDAKGYKEIYEKCAPVSSIINRKAKAYAGGELQVLNARTENEVTGQNKEWIRLLTNPNPIQSHRQFFRQLYTYTYLNGYALVMKMYPEAFNDRPSKLWVLPYWCIEVEDKKTPIYEMAREDLLRGIYFVYNGKKTPLDANNLILISDETASVDKDTWLPESRLEQCQYPVTTLLSSVEAEATMIQRKGAIGILSKKTDPLGNMPVDVDYKQDLQREFSRYGLTRDQWQVIITDADLQWQSMTFPTKDLMLHESYQKALKDLCDAYDFPFELTAHSDRKTLANVSSFDRILYQNAIIPEADSIDSQLMLGLNAEANNIIIKHSYSHIPALQESEKEKGDGRKALNDALQIEYNNGLITRNQWLEKLGEDKVSNPDFDKYKYELNNGNTADAGQAQGGQGTTTGNQSGQG